MTSLTDKAMKELESMRGAAGRGILHHRRPFNSSTVKELISAGLVEKVGETFSGVYVQLVTSEG